MSHGMKVSLENPSEAHIPTLHFADLSTKHAQSHQYQTVFRKCDRLDLSECGETREMCGAQLLRHSFSSFARC